MSRLTFLTLALLPASVTLFAQQSAPATSHTRVIRYTPPAHLPDRAKAGECAGPSVAADFRADAWRCTSGSTTYDPCFITAHADRVLCDVDPRDASSGTVLTLASSLPHVTSDSSVGGSRAWFFELTDGSTCRPLLGAARREIEGLTEIYTCRFGSAGDADAVMGDLDASGDVWTIQKTLINKKVDPQTIKSAMSSAVRTVWQ